MSIRVRRPDVERLELSAGDFLIVKKYLTAGEYRELLRASAAPIAIAAGETPTPAILANSLTLDVVNAGLAIILAYLLDWSFQDADGRLLVIADQSPAVVKAALNAIDAAAYMEVQQAIVAHQGAMQAQIADEKKTLSGPIASAKTLTSVA